MKTLNSRAAVLFTLALAFLFHSIAAAAMDEAVLSKGQTLYLPIYSDIWHGDRVVDGRYPLKNQVSALVSIRNTSLKSSIRVTSAKYFSTDGKLLKQYVGAPKTIGPMGTYELFVEKQEAKGGSGANFVIQWEAGAPTNPPVVEAIHADIRGHSTFTFVTAAHPINPEK
jgi:hypothetical protein